MISSKILNVNLIETLNNRWFVKHQRVPMLAVSNRKDNALASVNAVSGKFSHSLEKKGIHNFLKRNMKSEKAEIFGSLKILQVGS